MTKAGSINYTACVDWLQGCGSNVYTQFGEDGLIEACLRHVGETNRHCFEIGAADGRFFSNTLRLRELGWQSVLIESDAILFDKLNRDYGSDAVCIHAHCDDLDSVLSQTEISYTPDLGVIDIDGQDYWLWDNLITYRPRVMLVEISTRGEWEGIPAIGEPYPAQAGLRAIEDLGKRKGYSLVATTYCNALFIDSNELKKAESV